MEAFLAESSEAYDDDDSLVVSCTALAATGHYPEAIAHYETVLRLQPDHAQARQNLARLREFQATGR